MRNFLRVFLFLVMAWLPSVFPCGNEIKGLKPGPEFLAISMGEGNGWALDDDGMLVTAMLGSWCAQQFKDPRVEFTEAQSTCLQTVEKRHDLKQDFDNGMYSTTYYSGQGGSDKTWEWVKTECSIDIPALWAKEQEKSDNQPVTCASKVKGTARKAADRFHEYNKRMSNPEYLATLDASQEDKDGFVASMAAKEEIMKDFASMLENPGLKRKDLEPWFQRFAEAAPTESFAVVSSPAEGLNPEKLQTLPSVMMDMGGRFPGMMHAMCAFGIQDASIDALQQAQWLPFEQLNLDGGSNGSR